MVLIFVIHFFSRMTCSQSFLLENLTMVLSLCFLRRWHALIRSPVISSPICWNILQTVGSSSLSSIDEGNSTTSTHLRSDYWAFFQQCLSIVDICLHRLLFTFLITETSDSRFWKFPFKRLISAVSEAIVVLVCSCVLRNKSIIWFLLNALSVSSVYTPAITSTRLLQWQKVELNKYFTFHQEWNHCTSAPDEILAINPFKCEVRFIW